MDIKRNDLEAIIADIIKEGAEDFDDVVYQATEIIIDLLEGRRENLIEKILMKASPDKTLRIT